MNASGFHFLGRAMLVLLLSLLVTDAFAGYRWPRDGRRTGTDGYDYFVDRQGQPSEPMSSGQFGQDPTGSIAAVGKDPSTNKWVVRPAPGVCANLALHPVGSQAERPATDLGLVADVDGGDLSIRVVLVGSDGNGNPDMNNVVREITPRTVYQDGEQVVIHESLYEGDIENCHWIVLEVDDPSDRCDGGVADGDTGGDGDGDFFPPNGDTWPPWGPPTLPPTGGDITTTSEPPVFTYSDRSYCPLFSRILTVPDSREFVEIYNPNDFPLPLDEFYISNNNGYFYVPEKVRSASTTRAKGGTGNFFDARFPASTFILPFGYLTVSLSGSANFKSFTNACPDYELVDDGDTDCSTTQLMREAFTGSIPDTVLLPEADGHVAFYFWDTESPALGEIPDLVNDCDLINWGDDTTVRTDKTDVSLDGPDSDSTNSIYYDETDEAAQDTISPAPHDEGLLYVRTDFSEGTENQNTSLSVLFNGWLLQDETSENLSATWGTETVPTALTTDSTDDDDSGTTESSSSSGGCSLILPSL